MAKKKLTKSKVVAEEVIEDPIEYAEEVDEPIEDFEEVEGTIEVPESILTQSTFEFDEIRGTHEMSSMPVLGDEQGSMYIKASPLPGNDFNSADLLHWTSKTFFDFTYNCCHPENDSHCIECYNKARKG